VERELPSRERNLYQIMRRTVFRIQVMRLPHRALTALSGGFAMTGSDEPDESGNYERRHDPKSKLNSLKASSRGN
jgi:hypothetical protein